MLGSLTFAKIALFLEYLDIAVIKKPSQCLCFDFQQDDSHSNTRQFLGSLSLSRDYVEELNTTGRKVIINLFWNYQGIWDVPAGFFRDAQENMFVSHGLRKRERAFQAPGLPPWKHWRPSQSCSSVGHLRVILGNPKGIHSQEIWLWGGGGKMYQGEGGRELFSVGGGGVSSRGFAPPPPFWQSLEKVILVLLLSCLIEILT